MNSLDRYAAGKLAELDAKSLRRTLKVDTRLDGLWIERGGKRLLSFSCNDYLNLSHHPEVKAAAAEALARYGAGAGASRLVTGNHPPLAALEERLARMKSTEAACVFGAGYLANAGIAPCLVKDGDVIFIDELAHSCMWTGARLSGADLRPFYHNDLDHLADLLKDERGDYRHALVMTETVFSMDGDLGPLAEIAALCETHDAWLMTDDAHGLGVVAPKHGAAPLQMGTLSKAAGSFGGYLCASQAAIDLVKTRARTLVYSTGLPPASAAAALKALEIIETDAELVAKPLRKARRFTRALNMPDAESAIVPVVLGSPDRALSAARALEDAGFLVVAIRPPTVPEGTARLRFAFTAGHDDADIDRLADAVRPLL
ncbi:MAG TPA: aminotransferase class I/II-fold pyridoxal phosphate-dependent enzyme [Caulobacterales bacterium]|nr:aminotransferase class I/II-fold pyridoxal phosphate-dependent enzyme [Caulobacterales bacterium]